MEFTRDIIIESTKFAKKLETELNGIKNLNSSDNKTDNSKKGHSGPKL